MKIIILKKRILVNSALYISALFLILGMVYFISNKFKSLQTISPINITQNTQYDLTGDGKKDTFQLLSSQNKVDFNINCFDNDHYLSNQLSDKTLFTTNLHFEPKVYFHNLSRDNIPEIILLGSKNDKSMSYVFKWNKKTLICSIQVIIIFLVYWIVKILRLLNVIQYHHQKGFLH
ncbi:hypothetical protein [Clostridium beijerinckii]|uniref:hypothetical protein n=1 Tax=Clostridium beijerinckii TaxID=1520 RepID=UPI0018410949|nr:hypothetical protein [Clostridium beijerinckii]NSA88040.1 hypothetical protein [Clostridium beijerinckii]NYC58046.1 hypothetical protein [Clostridium beijerinckii]